MHNKKENPAIAVYNYTGQTSLRRTSMAYHDPGVADALDRPARHYVVAHAGSVLKTVDFDTTGIGDGGQARAEPFQVGAALHRHAHEAVPAHPAQELGPENLLQQAAEAGRGADGHERAAREVRVCSLGGGRRCVDIHPGGEWCIHAPALFLVMGGGVDRGWSTGRLLVPRQPIKVLDLGAAQVICQGKIAALVGNSSS